MQFRIILKLRDVLVAAKSNACMIKQQNQVPKKYREEGIFFDEFMESCDFRLLYLLKIIPNHPQKFSDYGTPGHSYATWPVEILNICCTAAKVSPNIYNHIVGYVNKRGKQHIFFQKDR